MTKIRDIPETTILYGLSSCHIVNSPHFHSQLQLLSVIHSQRNTDPSHKTQTVHFSNCFISNSYFSDFGCVW